MLRGNGAGLAGQHDGGAVRLDGARARSRNGVEEIETAVGLGDDRIAQMHAERLLQA
jgi:hypothetical protein